MLEVDNIYSIDYSQITWMRWIFVSVIVLLVYLLVRVLHDASEKMSLLGGWKKLIYDMMHSAYVLSGSVGILIVLITFIMIQPFVHGLLVFVIIVLGFTLLKNYFLGKMMQLKNDCYTGQKIKFNDTEGFIKEIGRTSITLQTAEGARHVSYVQMFNEGFTQLQSSEIGGLQSIYINVGDTAKNTIQDIKDRLWESPYLDWAFEPEVTITNIKNQFEVKVLLSERNHLDDFTNLISEWGYQCSIKK